MMVQQNKEEPKSFLQKTKEPIINARQIVAVMLTIIYEVVSNILVYSVMKDPNWIFIIINVIVGIVIIVFIALLRAAYPEEVPDKTILSAFWLIWKQVVDVLTDPLTSQDPDTKMNILEKSLQWDVREWDIAYQEKLAQQIQYYKERKEAQIEALETQLREIPEPRLGPPL